MPTYTFNNISPPEFEELCRDLLQQHLKLIFESFGEGKDDGIDLRCITENNKSIVVQCKRYNNFANLYASLKKELVKIKKFNPDRYIVSTAVSLLPAQKEKILKLLSPYIKSVSDIFGRNDLNNLISLYPEIEKKHFKLWFSNIRILDRILHNGVITQTESLISKIEYTSLIYVPNESFIRAKNILDKNNYVIISGIPGIGKTTLAYILVYHYICNNWEFVFISTNIDQAFRLFDKSKNQIFLFDDFLGSNFLNTGLNNSEDKQITNFIELVSNSDNKKIIFTTREYIWAQAKQAYHTLYEGNLDVSKCVIGMPDYTNLVKAKILYNHLYFSKVSKDYINTILKTNHYLSIINHPNFNPRIIETILKPEIISSIHPDLFWQKIYEHLTYPKNIWLHVYDHQISSFSQCILAILFTIKTPVLLEDLQNMIFEFAKSNSSKYGITYSEIEFKKALKELEQTFITINKINNKFVIGFQNPSVEDFLVQYFKHNQDFINDLIQSAIYYNQLFHNYDIENSISQLKSSFKHQYGYKIVLNDDVLKNLYEKIIRDFDTLVDFELNINTENISNILNIEKTLTSNFDKLLIFWYYFKTSKWGIQQFLSSKIGSVDIKFNIKDKNYELYVSFLKPLSGYIEKQNKISLLKHLSKEISSMNDIMQFIELRNLFTEEFQKFIENENLINTVENIVINHMHINILNPATLISNIKIIENVFKINLSYPLSLIKKEEIDCFEPTKKKFYPPQDYTVNVSQSNTLDESNLIIKMFDTLKDEKSNE